MFAVCVAAYENTKPRAALIHSATFQKGVVEAGVCMGAFGLAVQLAFKVLNLSG